MEEALSAITLSKSCPTDELFVFQVRLQLLKQRADCVRQQEETDYARTGTASVAASGPRFLYLKTLRVQLHELRSSFPPDLQHIGKQFLGRITWHIIPAVVADAFTWGQPRFTMQTSSTHTLNMLDYI